MSEEKTLNIYERMSLAGEEIAKVPKNLVIGTGKWQYHAVAEADILSAVKKAEKAHGIFSFPLSHELVESSTLENGSHFVRVKAVYRFLNMDDPTQFVDVSAFGDGVDTLDKAPGKAVTYADKYALMKAYKIETGDDTDNHPSDDLAGHDIWKIKERVERLMTQKMQNGMSQDELLVAMGMNIKQFNTCMNAFQNVAALEGKLLKV